ncbi:adenosine 3'-phospho 5'-phosphosulfate transporter 1 [Plodia interpunctella]|uniref:adenosine 3'-phospho 5'-phosphosulfate transporter 1 n=1 Tax=Plodia interpunctella TaxID=58824 RepID=UPI002368F31C|nr:adenosine 3'-phospho 5'-phosphosulfate transporter 1 [Plodia interpunctella]
MRGKIVAGVVTVSCLLLILVFARIYQKLLTAYEQSGKLVETEYAWVILLLLNLAGYAIILLPGLILYKYLDKSNYFDKIGTKTSCIYRSLFACFGDPGEKIPESVKAQRAEETPRKEALELAFCFIGLMGAYLIWGLLQEKIMTQTYVMPDGALVRFNESQFLVFVNRLSALLLALCRLLYSRQPLVCAPLYKFSYCSLTNIISAWCQYEALKYVSFPTQVLSKSCKVIPVMLMGKVISRKKYELYEYVTAVMISLGMMLFIFGSHDDNGVSTVTTMSGLTLLALYIMCDSFTSSWQSALFTRYGCSSLQMLCAVNLFSVCLTASALLQHAGSAHYLRLLQTPMFVWDCLLLSLSSTLGQLLIYRTIARFGAVVFTVIMTVRQAVAILLSCIVYGHYIFPSGIVGIILVFLAIFLGVYCRQRTRKRRAANV